jgi:branched-chain amino acid transport system permease protein
VQTRLDRLPGLAVEGLQFGLIIALAAVGLSLIYGTTGLTNFAHGELITLGALRPTSIDGNGTSFASRLLPVVSACSAACRTASCGGRCAKRARPDRHARRHASGWRCSCAVLPLPVRRPPAAVPRLPAAGADGLGPILLAPRALPSSSARRAAGGVRPVRTRIGKATRQSPTTRLRPSWESTSSGHPGRVVAGAGLAGLAGILLGFAQQVSFQLGFQILLLVFAAVTLGGPRHRVRRVDREPDRRHLHAGVDAVHPSELKNAGALAILIIILLVRPQGILGRAERVG